MEPIDYIVESLAGDYAYLKGSTRRTQSLSVLREHFFRRRSEKEAGFITKCWSIA